MQKPAVFIYGVISYLAFFVTFLYAAGFIGNFFVPKTIDTGDPTSLATALVVNAALLALFAVQHSVMARPAFKDWLKNFMPAAAERSTYVLISSLLLALLFWQWRPLPDFAWQIEAQAGRFVLWCLFWLGWIIVLVSTFMINHFDLFGLRQVLLFFFWNRVSASGVFHAWVISLRSPSNYDWFHYCLLGNARYDRWTFAIFARHNRIHIYWHLL